ncbi:MAG: CHAD domain-containing protein [Ginsengibacter sp.]
MQWQQKQEDSYISAAPVLRICLRKQLNTLERILKKRHRKISKKDIHNLRIAVKKIKSLSTLVLFCQPDFRIAKFMKPLKKIFKVGGEMRNLQLEIQKLKKMELHSLQDYLHQLKRRLKKKKQLFFPLADAQLRRKLRKRSKMILTQFAYVNKTCVNRFLEEKRIEISNLLLTENLKEKEAHQLRKKLKEFYYAILVFGIKDKRFRNIDDFQQLLGQWHNNVVLKDDLQKTLDKKDEPEAELKIIGTVENKISIESSLLFDKIKAGAAGIDRSLFGFGNSLIQ